MQLWLWHYYRSKNLQAAIFITWINVYKSKKFKKNSDDGWLGLSLARNEEWPIVCCILFFVPTRSYTPFFHAFLYVCYLYKLLHKQTTFILSYFVYSKMARWFFVLKYIYLEISQFATFSSGFLYIKIAFIFNIGSRKTKINYKATSS